MKKYLIFDGRLINAYKVSNAKLTLEKLKKDNVVFFKEDFFSDNPKNWEVRYDNSYPNVIYDKLDKKYKVYYTLFIKDEVSEATSLEDRIGKQYRPEEGRVTAVCYAESKDGINWIKPNLGLVEFKGSKNNNILIKAAHGTGIFLDEEEKDENKRYKLVTKIEYSFRNHFMAVAFSKDGINFSELIEWPKYNPAADTHNFPFRDKKTGKFVLITRTWADGIRIVAKCESNDFINWSEPVEIARGEGFFNQIYSMPVFQYEDYYLGLASMYHEGDITLPEYDLVDCTLMYSTKLSGWERICKDENFIVRGEGEYPSGAFDCGCIYASSPVEINDKLYFYYMGGNGQHTNFRETSFSRGYINKDQFAYYEQRNKETDAILVTRSVYLNGSNLRMHVDVTESSHIEVEITNQRGDAFDGFTYDNSEVTIKDNIAFIKFKHNDLGELIDNNIAINIKFKNAKLYSLEGDVILNRK